MTLWGALQWRKWIACLLQGRSRGSEQHLLQLCKVLKCHKGNEKFPFPGQLQFRGTSMAAGQYPGQWRRSVCTRNSWMFGGLRLAPPSPRSPRALFHCGQEETPGHHTQIETSRHGLLWETPGRGLLSICSKSRGSNAFTAIHWHLCL